MSTIYAGLNNQYIFKHQTVFSARFVNEDEDDQVLVEVKLYNNLNNNQNLTEFDDDKFDSIRSQLGRHH